MQSEGKSVWPYMRANRRSRLPGAWPRILTATAIAAAVTLIEFRTQWNTYSLTTTPFTIMGVAISFFLGFRNNNAYNRFWEARTLWGRLNNACRAVERQILTLIALPEPTGHSADEAERLRALQQSLVQTMLGYVHALHHYLHDTDPFTDLRRFLPEDEIERLRSQNNVPLAILHLLGRQVEQARRAGWVDAPTLLLLDNSLTEFTQVQGGCERIKNTPVPETYTILSHRIVSFFCYALPFGIFDTVKLLTPLVVFMVSYAFFGLDTLGEEISDPFGDDPHDLPLSTFTDSIEKNARRILEYDRALLQSPAEPENHFNIAQSIQRN